MQTFSFLSLMRSPQKGMMGNELQIPSSSMNAEELQQQK